MALVEEILTKTSLEDTDQMLMNAMQAAFMPGYIAQNQPTQLANILLPAMTTKAGKYNYFVSFLQTDFEESLLAMDEDGLEAAKADMEQVWQIALSGNNASAFCIGDEEAQTKAEPGGDGVHRRARPHGTRGRGLHGAGHRAGTAMSRWKCREACNTTIWFCRRRRRALLTAAKPM